MRFKHLNITIDEIGLKIVIKQKKLKRKFLKLFPIYNTKTLVLWKPFKNGIVNNLIDYKLGDWVIVEKDFKNYTTEVHKIKPLKVVQNVELLNKVNRILIKLKGVSKWNSKL